VVFESGPFSFTALHDDFLQVSVDDGIRVSDPYSFYTDPDLDQAF
jgi:hypothetical protein